MPFRTDAKSHPQTDFAPNLRFVPSIQPTQWVTIVFADNVAAFDPKFSILYRADPHARCIDEAKHDPTLATVRNPLNGMITRGIKHFSCYLVGVGESDGMDAMFNWL